MKKTIAIIVLLVCGTMSLMAQEKVSFKAGLRVGANFSTLYGVESDGQIIPTIFSAAEKYKMKPGVRAGLVFDIGLTPKVSIQPAIYYSWQRWGSEGQCYATFNQQDTFIMRTKEVMNMQLVQIPVLVNFRLKFKNNEKNAFVFGVGPYFSVALAGQDAMEGTLIDQNNEANYWKIRGKANFYKDEKISLYKTEQDDFVTEYPTGFYNHPFRRCDFGFSVAVGFELKKFYIGAGADFGVINTANVNEWERVGIREYSQRNLNLQVNLGYYF